MESEHGMPWGKARGIEREEIEENFRLNSVWTWPLNTSLLHLKSSIINVSKHDKCAWVMCINQVQHLRSSRILAISSASDVMALLSNSTCLAKSGGRETWNGLPGNCWFSTTQSWLQRYARIPLDRHVWTERTLVKVSSLDSYRKVAALLWIVCGKIKQGHRKWALASRLQPVVAQHDFLRTNRIVLQPVLQTRLLITDSLACFRQYC